MNICLTIIATSLPLIFWWRFRNVPLDRDYAPYAYPGVFKTGYLKDGHVDIKGPLIHWSYKVWLGIVSLSRSPLVMKLRFLPLTSISGALLLLGSKGLTVQSLVLAALICSPTLWPHMANTEWMTVSLLSAALILPPSLQWVCLGLLPWINQKNILLIAPVAWALGLNLSPIIPHALALVAPTLCITAYLQLTGRKIPELYFWLVGVPKIMGSKRTLKQNTLPAMNLNNACIYMIAPFMASMDWHSPWALVAVVVVGMMILSKQVVPHHFLLLAFPVAMASNPSLFTFIAFGCVWLTRDLVVWINPALIYPVTFGKGSNAHYGLRLTDSLKIEEMIRNRTKPDDVIWVNGMENHIYLNAMRRAWRIEIPELEGIPAGEAPEYIVHCAQSAKKFDYLGYEAVEISNLGFYTLMRKQ